MEYRADATKLEAGSIVKVERPFSSTGRPTHPHFFIVLDVPDKLKLGDFIPMVGVSSKISASGFDPAKHVSMKWLDRRGGNPETGFDRPCFACVDFPSVVEVVKGRFPLEVAAAFGGKFISADKLHTLVALRNAFARNQPK